MKRDWGKREADRPSRYRLALLALLALALLLRLIRLDFQPLWWDEGYTMFFATRDFFTMLARTAVDIHPPLYYALLQVWIPLAGKTDVALRLFSVLAGVAAVPLIYLLGRKLFDARAGLFAAFLLAISPLHIYYSQEVRMYGLVTLLTLAAILLQLALLEGKSNERLCPWLWAGYVAANAAALYTQYFAAYAIAAQVAVAVLHIAGRRMAWRQLGEVFATKLRPWLLAWLATFLLFLPWLVYAGPKLYTYVTAKVGIEQYASLDPITFAAQHFIAFSIGHVTLIAWLGAGALVFLALAVFGIANQGLRAADTRPLTTNDPLPFTSSLSLLLFLLIPVGLAWLVNLFFTFHPIRYERLLLFCAPVFYVLVALGIDWLWRRQRGFAFAALASITLLSAVSLSDFYTAERYSAEDYRPLVQEMEAKAAAGDLVLAPYPWQIGYLESYYHGPTLRIFEVPAEWGAVTNEIDPGLDGLGDKSSRVWLIAWQQAGRRLEDLLANHYVSDYRLHDDWYGNTRLEYFGNAADVPLSQMPVPWGLDLALTSWSGWSGSVEAGNGFIPARLLWRAQSGGYSYSLRLVGADGEKKIAQDGPIPQGGEMLRIGLVVPRALTPGEYSLRLVVYRSSDGSVVARPGGEADLTLGQVIVRAAQ